MSSENFAYLRRYLPRTKTPGSRSCVGVSRFSWPTAAGSGDATSLHRCRNEIPDTHRAITAPADHEATADPVASQIPVAFKFEAQYTACVAFKGSHTLASLDAPNFDRPVS